MEHKETASERAEARREAAAELASESDHFAAEADASAVAASLSAADGKIRNVILAATKGKTAAAKPYRVELEGYTAKPGDTRVAQYRGGARTFV